jgi:hypothetical protein
MSSHVHVFEPRVGGTFRVSLTYDSAGSQGKTNFHTDTYHGHFVSLVPNSLVVEVMEFETIDPAMSGEMLSLTLVPLRTVERAFSQPTKGFLLVWGMLIISLAGECHWINSSRCRAARPSMIG